MSSRDVGASVRQRLYPFEGENLIQAIVAIFRRRGTRMEAEPVALTEAFYNADPARDGARSCAGAGSTKSPATSKNS